MMRTGGSINGFIAAADRMLEVANPETKIIRGHGPLSNAKELREYRDMLAAIRDRVLSQIRVGKTLEQIIASKPTEEFDASRRGSRSPADFVTMVYQSLTRNSQ